MAWPSLRMFSVESMTSATSRQPDRRAVAPGDDQRRGTRPPCRLVVGIDLVAPVADLDARPWAELALAAARAARTLSRPMPVLVERRRVDLDRAPPAASCRPASTWPTPLTWLSFCCRMLEAASYRRPWPSVFEVSAITITGASAGLILRYCGLLRRSARHVGAGGVDGGLHVARRPVDAARQVELQGDARIADRARRGDLGDAGDGAQPPLERRRRRWSPPSRRGAGQAGRDRDGREIDLGQRRHRQRRRRRPGRPAPRRSSAASWRPAAR